MARVLVLVEGESEESFVQDILAPALWPRGVYAIPIGLNGRTNYPRVKGDALRILKQDRGVYCSTMLDLFRLGRGYPGTPLPENIPGLEKVRRVERAIADDLLDAIPELRPDVRFIPHLQLHEYEALLFSDPEVLAEAIGQTRLAARFRTIRDDFATPEDMNDGPDTAPSKRVLALYPSYSKVIDGTLAAQAIGIARMRKECPHFRDWLERLEALAPVG